MGNSPSSFQILISIFYNPDAHTVLPNGEKKVKVLVAQSCPTLCNPVDCSLPGSSILGFSQAKILEWVPFPSPKDLTDSGSEPGSPAGRFFTI